MEIVFEWFVMGQNKRISAEQFFKAFCDQWSIEVQERRVTCQSPYQCRAEWTRRICSRDGLLARVTGRLNGIDARLACRTEWYAVDGLIVGGKDTHRKDLSYPSKVYAVIEHELGTDIETEAWKLSHWLAPLKVLIF